MAALVLLEDNVCRELMPAPVLKAGIRRRRPWWCRVRGGRARKRRAEVARCEDRGPATGDAARPAH